ncbi:hypothetical protein NDU88_004016 [Pleurodeles waltl]|uniref:Uncharacterized protein n=1 Tax=Pleurodeles waltl TaxID=8319 RepID=A0AAV7M746_PLEWA|nr:hypothetical protein NDU88_004016 [Pleurodeles waltl]
MRAPRHWINRPCGCWQLLQCAGGAIPPEPDPKTPSPNEDTEEERSRVAQPRSRLPTPRPLFMITTRPGGFGGRGNGRLWKLPPRVNAGKKRYHRKCGPCAR